MGDIADMMLDGTLDEQTGEYIGKAVGYPRTTQKGYYNSFKQKDTPAERNIRKVRKELALLIERYKQEGVKSPVGTARRDINLKYGKGWRERGLCVNDSDQWKPLSEY